MKEIIRRCVKMNTDWFTMRKNARLVNFNVVLHPTNNAVLHPFNNVVLHPFNNVVLHPVNNVVLHPVNNVVLHPVNNVVLHHVNNVVLHPLIQQCCRQGRSVMITMLLQHCSTINMFLLVNKVSTLYYRANKFVLSIILFSPVPTTMNNRRFFINAEQHY